MTLIKELPKRQNLPIFNYLSEQKKQTNNIYDAGGYIGRKCICCSTYIVKRLYKKWSLCIY